MSRSPAIPSRWAEQEGGAWDQYPQSSEAELFATSSPKALFLRDRRGRMVLAIPPKRRCWMLEGLNSVDWGRLTHAYGEAANVPSLIRGLSSDDEEERREGLGELFGTIWHRGRSTRQRPLRSPF